ncbi:uncharacterized protein LOC136027707 [Artemia franciscana]|uniref:uncharacterized protein LOC136027707 n=1 Tax=Artemia franciscana TaxID=6661 RepID=UPI0032D9F6EC
MVLIDHTCLVVTVTKWSETASIQQISPMACCWALNTVTLHYIAIIGTNQNRTCMELNITLKCKLSLIKRKNRKSLCPKATKSICSWKLVNERILNARFLSKQAKLSLIVCYAPDNYADDILKYEFYDNFQCLVGSIIFHNVTRITGDHSAKRPIGHDRSYCPEMMGHHGLGTTNGNGAQLVSCAMRSDLLIGGTLFQHKNIPKNTWAFPDGPVKNQIDYFLIHRRWQTSLKDVRSIRSADVGSYHELVVTTLKLKLKSNNRKLKTDILRSFDVDKVIDKAVRYLFDIELSNKFEALYTLPEDVEEAWETIRKSYTDRTDENLWLRKLAKYQWTSMKAWNLIEIRKKLKLSSLGENGHLEATESLACKEADKNIKKSATSDRRQYT